MDFESRVVLITGGNAGIGRATALLFARHGARVVVSARREAEGQGVVSEIRAAGGEAMFVRADVAKAADVEALVARTVEAYGGLDCAFNNAGILGSKFVPSDLMEESVWDDVIAVNLKGVWLSMKYEVPEMLKRGKGAIVNMSSVAGLMGGTLSVAYSASKHGVIGATKVVASEYAASGLRVNAVCPAVIRTAMADQAFLDDPETNRHVTSMHPIGRVGTPEEVAEAVVWLCSDKASFITGHSLVIDGGLLL